jgi:ABC-type phosphate transport system ATPase subunit
LLLLDLAQVSIYNSIYEESPVLLIDDIDAELDRGRIEALLSELDGRVQTVVSTSRRAIANRYRDRASVYCVEAGQAMSETGSKNSLFDPLALDGEPEEVESSPDDLESAANG